MLKSRYISASPTGQYLRASFSTTLLVLGGAGGPQALLPGFEGDPAWGAGNPLAFPPPAAEGGTERI
ncbi:MAG: hypothetical protein ACJ797_22020 [Ktedonobacteraceae bacterium]